MLLQVVHSIAESGALALNFLPLLERVESLALLFFFFPFFFNHDFHAGHESALSLCQGFGADITLKSLGMQNAILGGGEEKH